ncbi:hypothetical protein [Glycomyces buryatensis]|uniref:DUF4878 domain-containing protein n=1 Tax=Glycomyces buryatensis TaxID=2570927 RepID=A0A4S8QCZ4_9ACTN|nr:hypothetical protein [Glycomyces buryatensis]THV42407.1 hypothetical protein FAB82_07070 [Glycomyces buryatensis]
MTGPGRKLLAADIAVTVAIALGFGGLSLLQLASSDIVEVDTEKVELVTEYLEALRGGDFDAADALTVASSEIPIHEEAPPSGDWEIGEVTQRTRDSSVVQATIRHGEEEHLFSFRVDTEGDELLLWVPVVPVNYSPGDFTGPVKFNGTEIDLPEAESVGSQGTIYLRPGVYAVEFAPFIESVTVALGPWDNLNLNQLFADAAAADSAALQEQIAADLTALLENCYSGESDADCTGLPDPVLEEVTIDDDGYDNLEGHEWTVVPPEVIEVLQYAGATAQFGFYGAELQLTATGEDNEGRSTTVRSRCLLVTDFRATTAVINGSDTIAFPDPGHAESCDGMGRT